MGRLDRASDERVPEAPPMSCMPTKAARRTVRCRRTCRKAPREGDGGVGEAGRAGEPVGRGDVSRRPRYATRSCGRRGPCRKMTTRARAWRRPRQADARRRGGGGWRSDGRQAEHQVGDDAPRQPPATWAAISRPRSRVATAPERALDQGDDRVERGRHRLQGQDQGDEGRAGGDRCSPAAAGRRRRATAACAAMPEPMTAVTRNAVPTSSASARRASPRSRRRRRRSARRGPASASGRAR